MLFSQFQPGLQRLPGTLFRSDLPFPTHIPPSPTPSCVSASCKITRSVAITASTSLGIYRLCSYSLKNVFLLGRTKAAIFSCIQLHHMLVEAANEGIQTDMEALLKFIQDHKLYFDAAHALNSVLGIIMWCVGAVVVAVSWRRIKSVSMGPLNFQFEEAVDAAATAARDWQAKTGGVQTVDLPQIRATIGPAFTPEVADNLIGKSILWVDDNPANNELIARTLRKLRLNVEQATSTESALAEMQRRHFDLVISDMGRGSDKRAGYGLLKAIRGQGNNVPFLIFSSSDKPEYRKEAAVLGAQLSTNDMLELFAHVIKHLSKTSAR